LKKRNILEHKGFIENFSDNETKFYQYHIIIDL